MADNLPGHAICPQCCFCGHSVANPGDMCGMCAGSMAAHQRQMGRGAADSPPNARKLIADVAMAHRGKRCWNDVDLWTQCFCGERFYDPTKWALHLAAAVDEALGGLSRETEMGWADADVIQSSRFVSGWTPEAAQ